MRENAAAFWTRIYREVPNCALMPQVYFIPHSNTDLEDVKKFPRALSSSRRTKFYIRIFHKTVKTIVPELLSKSRTFSALKLLSVDKGWTLLSVDGTKLWYSRENYNKSSMGTVLECIERYYGGQGIVLSSKAGSGF